MKLLFLTTEFYWGGSQKSLIKLYQALQHEYDCSICFTNIGQPVANTGLPEALSLQSVNTQNPFLRMWYFYKRIQELKKIKRLNKFTHTISFGHGSSLLNRLSKQKNEVLIFSCRGSLRNDIKGKGFLGAWLFKRKISLIYNAADVIVPVSLMLAEELVKEFSVDEKKIKTIYNFYNAADYKILSLQAVEPTLQHIFDNFYTAITVGRLEVEKNIGNLLYVISAVRQNLPGFKLIVVGTGSLLEEYIGICQKLELSYFDYRTGKLDITKAVDIYFLGYQTNPHKYVARASLFCLPSLNEGFPNTLAEAMITGTVVVSSDCQSGPGEILGYENKYGILLPVLIANYSDKVWAYSIEALINNWQETKKYVAHAQERMQQFSAEKIIPQWKSVIDNT